MILLFNTLLFFIGVTALVLTCKAVAWHSKVKSSKRELEKSFQEFEDRASELLGGHK